MKFLRVLVACITLTLTPHTYSGHLQTLDVSHLANAHALTKQQPLLLAANTRSKKSASKKGKAKKKKAGKKSKKKTVKKGKAKKKKASKKKKPATKKGKKAPKRGGARPQPAPGMQPIIVQPQVPVVPGVQPIVAPQPGAPGIVQPNIPAVPMSANLQQILDNQLADFNQLIDTASTADEFQKLENNIAVMQNFGHDTKALEQKLQQQKTKVGFVEPAPEPRPVRRQPAEQQPARQGAVSKVCISKEFRDGYSKAHGGQPFNLTQLPAGMIDRFCIVEDILGMPEKEFQAQVGTVGQKPDPNTVRIWFDANKAKLAQQTSGRSDLIMQGTWHQISLGQLRTDVAAQLLSKDPATLLQNPGKLETIVFNCKKFTNKAGEKVWDKKCWDKNSDIRYLQESFAKTYTKPFFVVASTFMALEGFMGNYGEGLSHMNYRPVQGEEAELGTIAAALYRRYFLPDINLLQGITKTLSTHTKNGHEWLINGLAHGVTGPVKSDAMAGFDVGVHENIPVTSGYADNQLMPRPDNKRWIPLYNKQFDGSLHISQIYTAAHNINVGNYLHDKNQRAVAHVVLMAAYEASLLAAIKYGADALVLTMLGAGAFRNETDWIIDALNRLAPVIIASGIPVFIVVRHEFPETQKKFEKKINQIIEHITAETNIYKKHPEELTQDLTKFFNKAVDFEKRSTP